MRAFLPWRRSFPALVTGPIEFIDMPEPVMALVRRPEARNEGPAILAVFNLGPDPVRVTLPACFQTITMNVPELPPEQQGERIGPALGLPAHGIYFAALEP